jgi:hypothetical protein
MKLFSSAIAIACLAVASFAYGQEPGQGAPPAPNQQQTDTPKVSVTGCLAKGDGANTYMITDQKSGDKLPFSGPDKLDKYVNQTVTLTGTMSAAGSAKVFKPERISTVSPSCEKGQ